MAWLGRLTLRQAFGVAMIWPAAVAGALALMLFVISRRGDFVSMGWSFAPGSGGALALAGLGLFFGPSVVILALWGIVRR